MVIKKSSVNGNGCKRGYVASQRRPGRPMKNSFQSQSLPFLPAPKNNISQIMKERSEMDNVTQDNRPSFFKIILGSVKERLRIPPKFLPNILKDLTKTATLKIFCSGVWTVQISNTKDGVFMEDGWQQFHRENYLKDGHFLVFTYDGDMSFSVQIFELNGLERVHAGFHSTTKPPQEGAGPSNNGKRPRGRPKKNPIQTVNPPLLPAVKNLSQVEQVNALHVSSCKKIDMVKKVKKQGSSKPQKKSK